MEYLPCLDAVGDDAKLFVASDCVANVADVDISKVDGVAAIVRRGRGGSI